MSEIREPQFLYLTTTGRVSGKPHTIEIWFVARDGNYYLMSEGDGRKDWIENLRRDPAVSVSVGSRDVQPMGATARIVDKAAEPELTRTVAALMDAKYQWADGLIVELKPKPISALPAAPSEGA